MSPIAALMLASAFAPLACPQNVIFRTDVTLMHVDAEVIGEDGRVIEGLKGKDFRLYDNGREQPILQFAAGDVPLDLILLFDVSGSMRPIVSQVAAAAHEGLRQLQPGDRVSVMVFDTRSYVVSPFTEDLDEIARVIRQDVLQLEFDGGTLIQQAVDDAALRFFREPRTGRRRAVLVITDDIGRRTRREQTIVRNFWEADALLSGLIVSSPGSQAMRTIGTILGPHSLLLQAGMKGIARRTGGDAIRAEDAATAFGYSMRRIRTRYGLYYAMPRTEPGTKHKIRVELSAEAADRLPKAKVRARSGYIAPNRPDFSSSARASGILKPDAP